MSCSIEHGGVALAAMGNSSAEADTLYRRAARILHEARAAVGP